MGLASGSDASRSTGLLLHWRIRRAGAVRSDLAQAGRIEPNGNVGFHARRAFRNRLAASYRAIERDTPSEVPSVSRRSRLARRLSGENETAGVVPGQVANSFEMMRLREDVRQ